MAIHNCVFIMPVVVGIYIFIVARLPEQTSSATKYFVARRLLIVSASSCAPYLVKLEIMQIIPPKYNQSVSVGKRFVYGSNIRTEY